MRIERDSLKKILLSVLWLMLMVIRSGLHFYNPPPILIETVKQFPEPVSFGSGNVIPALIFHILEVNSEFRWKIFSSALTATVFLTIILTIQFRTGKLRNLYSAFAISTPAFTLLAGNIGIWDIFPLIFWLLFFFGPLKFRSASVWLLMLSSPEQGLVSLIAIWFLEKSLGKSFTNNQTKKYLLHSAVIIAVLNVWILSNRVPSRGWLLIKNFLGSAEVFISSFPNLFLSGYGPAWLIFLFFAFKLNVNSRFLLFVSVVVIPTVFTILTLDGSRVFIMVSIPLVIIILKEIARDHVSIQILNENTVLISLIFLFYPTLIVFGGAVYQPLSYEFLSNWIGSLNVHWAVFVENLQSSLGRI
jgi:hypothetical protein